MLGQKFTQRMTFACGQKQGCYGFTGTEMQQTNKVWVSLQVCRQRPVTHTNNAVKTPSPSVTCFVTIYSFLSSNGTPVLLERRITSTLGNRSRIWFGKYMPSHVFPITLESLMSFHLQNPTDEFVHLQPQMFCMASKRSNNKIF